MRFRDRPIRLKLLVMTLTSTATALVLASGGFLAWDIIQFRSELQQDLRAQARIVADNSGAPLTFGDDRAAAETLAVLRLRPRIRIACLYGAANDGVFATYRRETRAACPADPPTRTNLGWAAFDVVEPVMAGDDRVGTLFISRDLDDLAARVRIGGATMLGLLLLAITTAFLISARIQRAIVTPLLQLADTARAVSSTRDYALRATASSNDEVGVVVRSFNEMLVRIGERSAELSKANAELEREIEERRKVEAERAAALTRERDANRLKDEFLATLSHELRTPLNAVLGWARVLRTAHVEPATHDRALETIERNAQAQVRLIEDLLEISRIVTGKLRLQVRETDLAAIVDAAVEVVRPAATAKQQELAVAIQVRPALTSGDPDRLQQVVWNLLSNAVKFTPPHGRINVTLTRATGYHLAVGDTGRGIEAKFLPFVFDQFRQADGSASREYGGLGLGLAIAKQVVELHGGTIVATSAGTDTGATFEVTLPSIITSPIKTPIDRTMPGPEVTLADPLLLAGLDLLVVDDEEDARALLETAMIQYGAHVIAVESVDEAMQAIERRVPDVLLSDIGMPHEDGYSLIRRIRARPLADGGALPAIAITAYASDTDRTAVRAAGFHAHVAKPFDPREVASRVAELAHALHRSRI